jgi:hypothetical protein
MDFRLKQLMTAFIYPVILIRLFLMIVMHADVLQETDLPVLNLY